MHGRYYVMQKCCRKVQPCE